METVAAWGQMIILHRLLDLTQPSRLPNVRHLILQATNTQKEDHRQNKCAQWDCAAYGWFCPSASPICEWNLIASSGGLERRSRISWWQSQSSRCQSSPRPSGQHYRLSRIRQKRRRALICWQAQEECSRGLSPFLGKPLHNGHCCIHSSMAQIEQRLSSSGSPIPR